MAGLLDGLVGDDTTKDEFGQTQADRRAPLWSGLINAGLLAMAGGGNLMPAERAKYIAAAGGALGGIGTDMIQARSAAAQQALRGQEIKSKAVDLAQSQKWRDYASSPEFQAALDQAKASPAEIMEAKAAAMKGDFATVTKVLDPKRSMPQVSGNLIRMPDGSIVNTLGRVVVGADGKPATGGGSNAFDPAKSNVGGTDRLNMAPLQDGQVPHDIAVQALQVARGEIAPPTVRTNPDAAVINNLAAQVAGTNGTAFKVRQGFEQSITSGGKTDQTVIAPWSKMMQHGAAAQQAFDELQHRDGGKWAALLDKGTLNKAMISDPNVVRIVAEYQTEMRNYVQEAQKLIAGGGQLTEGARAEVEGVNNPAKPPAEQIGHMHAFTNMTKPVMDQLLANGRRMRHNSALELPDLGINPESLKAHDYLQQRFASGPGTGTPAAGAPAGGGPALAEGEKNLGPLSGGKFKIQKADGSIVVR